jgi:hypothetical protein
VTSNELSGDFEVLVSPFSDPCSQFLRSCPLKEKAFSCYFALHPRKQTRPCLVCIWIGFICVRFMYPHCRAANRTQTCGPPDAETVRFPSMLRKRSQLRHDAPLRIAMFCKASVSASVAATRPEFSPWEDEHRRGDPEGVGSCCAQVQNWCPCSNQHRC